MSNEVSTTVKPGGLAAPVNPIWGGDDNISASDVKAPEIRITQGNSEAAKEGYAQNGNVIFTYGSDDANPTILVSPRDGLDSFVGFVIAREKFAATTTGGGLTFHADGKRDMADPKSWDGWMFYISVPEVDPTLPARTMMWKSNAPVARQINGFIQRAKARGDYDPIPVRIGTKFRQNDKGSWYIYTVAQIAKDEVEPDLLAIADSQREIAFDMIQERQNYQNRPASTPVEQPEV